MNGLISLGRASEVTRASYLDGTQLDGFRAVCPWGAFDLTSDGQEVPQPECDITTG